MLIARQDSITLARLMNSLARSVATDEVDDDLLGALDEVLDTNESLMPPAPPRRFGTLLSLLPYRPQRSQHVRVKAAPLSDGDEARIIFQLRRATYPAIARVKARVDPAPVELISLLLALHEEKPARGDNVGYLRRYASTILTLLDLAGGHAK